MAYRQLFAAACFACGFAAAACGGSNGSAADTDTTSDAAPTNGDQARFNGDQASGSRDQPPANKDQPPASSDQPPSSSPGGQSGGGAEAACRAFCNQFGGAEGCPGDNQLNAAVRAICDSGCTLDDDEQFCQAEVVAALNCIAGLPGLCTANGPSDNDAAACRASQQAVSACEDAHEPPDMDPEPCSMAGGCNCGDDCESCQCLLGAASPTCDAACM